MVFRKAWDIVFNKFKRRNKFTKNLEKAKEYSKKLLEKQIELRKNNVFEFGIPTNHSLWKKSKVLKPVKFKDGVVLAHVLDRTDGYKNIKMEFKTKDGIVWLLISKGEYLYIDSINREKEFLTGFLKFRDSMKFVVEFAKKGNFRVIETDAYPQIAKIMIKMGWKLCKEFNEDIDLERPTTRLKYEI